MIDLFSKPVWHKTQCNHGCLEGQKGQARCKVNDADNSYSNHAEYEWKVAVDENKKRKKSNYQRKVFIKRTSNPYNTYQ